MYWAPSLNHSFCSYITGIWPFLFGQGLELLLRA